MKENFPNLAKEIDLQVQDAHREPQTRWMQRGPLQDRILKRAREKKLVTYRGLPIRLSDFSKETL